MTFHTTPFEGLLILEPRIFRDNRGYFFESYNQSAFDQVAKPVGFVQDNQSMSNKGVLRGLHFQRAPYGQGKLVRVARGAVLDIAVDIRKTSSTFGNFFSMELNDKTNTMLWIPEGFAHGFLTLEDNTLFLYKCSGQYNKESESGIRYDDPELKINWNENNPVLSEKDLQLPSWKDFLKSVS